MQNDCSTPAGLILDVFENKIGYYSFYNIGAIKLQISELQINTNKANKLRSSAVGLLKGWEDNKKVFQ